MDVSLKLNFISCHVPNFVLRLDNHQIAMLFEDLVSLNLFRKFHQRLTKRYYLGWLVSILYLDIHVFKRKVSALNTKVRLVFKFVGTNLHVSLVVFASMSRGNSITHGFFLAHKL